MRNAAGRALIPGRRCEARAFLFGRKQGENSKNANDKKYIYFRAATAA